MSNSYERFQKRRLISSYFSVILSIFLVLFLLGSLGMFVINAEKISNTFKENIPMTIFFKDEIKDADLEKIQAEIEQQTYLKDITFVHKDSAAEEHQKTIGENFVHFLGYNPLQHSFDIHLNGEYVQKDSIKNIELAFKENPLVDDVIYDQELVTLVNDNVEHVTFWVLIISAALAVIAVLILTSYVDKQLPTLELMSDYRALAIVTLGIFIVGIIITWISTYFATQRFLNLKSDDLY